jgi:hypothetical protein
MEEYAKASSNLARLARLDEKKERGEEERDECGVVEAGLGSRRGVRSVVRVPCTASVTPVVSEEG